MLQIWHVFVAHWFLKSPSTLGFACITESQLLSRSENPVRVGASAPVAQPQSSCSSCSEPSSAPPPGTRGLCCLSCRPRLPWHLLRRAPSPNAGLSPTHGTTSRTASRSPPRDAPGPLLLYYVTPISLFHIISFLKIIYLWLH